MDVNRNWTFCIIGQWFDWNTPINRPYKFVSSRHVKREKASLPVYMRLVVPNSPAAAILKTEKGLETRLSQESIICVANCLKFEWQMLQITRHSSNEKLHKKKLSDCCFSFTLDVTSYSTSRSYYQLKVLKVLKKITTGTFKTSLWSSGGIQCNRVYVFSILFSLN